MEFWGDEAGDRGFGPDASRYYFVGTVLVTGPDLAHDLMRLRIRLAIRGFDLPEGFHASADDPAVRTRVFEVLRQREFMVHTTSIDKHNIPPEHQADHRLFKWAWLQHHKYFLPKLVTGDFVFVGLATIATHDERKRHDRALRGAINEVLTGVRVGFAHWPAATHPCLQAADYCMWAIRRSVEDGEDDFRGILRNQIKEIRHI
jgi:hypothetical protein